MPNSSLAHSDSALSPFPQKDALSRRCFGPRALTRERWGPGETHRTGHDTRSFPKSFPPLGADACKPSLEISLCLCFSHKPSVLGPIGSAAPNPTGMPKPNTKTAGREDKQRLASCEEANDSGSGGGMGLLNLGSCTQDPKERRGRCVGRAPLVELHWPRRSRPRFLLPRPEDGRAPAPSVLALKTRGGRTGRPEDAGGCLGGVEWIVLV